MEAGMKPEPEPTPTERLLALLADRPGLTCTEVGESLWPSMKSNRQAMSRPDWFTKMKVVVNSKTAELMARLGVDPETYTVSDQIPDQTLRRGIDLFFQHGTEGKGLTSEPKERKKKP